jgi:hypothetical protein
VVLVVKKKEYKSRSFHFMNVYLSISIPNPYLPDIFTIKFLNDRGTSVPNFASSRCRNPTEKRSISSVFADSYTKRCSLAPSVWASGVDSFVPGPTQSLSARTDVSHLGSHVFVLYVVCKYTLTTVHQFYPAVYVAAGISDLK